MIKAHEYSPVDLIPRFFFPQCLYSSIAVLCFPSLQVVFWVSGFLIVIFLSILLTKLVADQRGAIYADIDGME